MISISQASIQNLLLSGLSAGDYALLRPHLERVQYEVGSHIGRVGERIDFVCFPEGSVCALLLPMRRGHPLAVGIVGNEGVLGARLVQGALAWRHDVVVRGVDSTGLKISTPKFLEACRQSPTLTDRLLRFADCLLVQISRATVANLVEPLERRMARWILLYHDRLEGDEIKMTHEEISIMLGVRRASATETLHVLEGHGAIKSARGRIIVRDRSGLEAIAGETYGDAEANYRELLGPFGKSGPSSA